MKFWELYNFIQSRDYHTSGKNLDWIICVAKGNGVDFLMLLFEGSKTKEDYVDNFNFFPSKLYKNQSEFYLVERGWAKTYKASNDKIISAWITARRRYPNHKTVVGGFSYGSAMALLASEDIWFTTGEKVDLLATFGSVKPLFGWKAKKHYKQSAKHIYQFAHVNDIVGYCIPLLGYTRVDSHRLGKKGFNLFKMFDVLQWHLSYGRKDLYEDINLTQDIEEVINSDEKSKD